MKPALRPPPSRLARALEGWQVGAIPVVFTALVCLVVVPRSAIPDGLPLPTLTAEERASASENAFRMAESATYEGGLAGQDELRSALDEVGRSEVTKDRVAAERARVALRLEARKSLSVSPAAVAVLGAYRAHRWVHAYGDYQRTGELSDELSELGGDLLNQMMLERWMAPGEPPPEDFEFVLRGLYARRFRTLVGDHPALGASPVDEKAVIGFFLTHPPRQGQPRDGGDRAATDGRFVLRQIEAMRDLDPTYPAPYAQGIAYFHMGRFEESALAFQAFLSDTPDGPYRLRAINFLKTAVEHSAQ